MCIIFYPQGLHVSLVPRPPPDFISQLWRKIGRRPGIIATSRARNGGHGYYKPSSHYVLGSPPFPAHDVAMIPGLLPIFSSTAVR